MGSPTAIHDALAASKTPLATPAAAAPPPAVDLDTAQLDQLIGAKGQANGGVYQFNVPRRDPVTENGMQLTPVGPLGVAIAINFQPTGGGRAAITGDFVLTGDEVNPVIKALRANGIDVTAVHSHNHAPDIAAMDLFVVPTIGFSLLYAFVIVHLDRRNLVWINVTTNPTAEWVARQMTEAFPWDDAPKYLIRDRDRIYGAVDTPIARHGHPAVKQHACGTSYPTKRLSVISGRRS